MTTKLTVLAAVAATLAGCASYRSSYGRATASPDELIWGYDNGLQATQRGQVIAEAGDWDGLASAVACVPQARRWAESASSRDSWGKTLLWSGVVIMLAGVAGGSYLMLQDTSDTDQLLTGLGVMGGGLVVGMITVPFGAVERARGETEAIDAVNLYNDELWAGRCVR